VRDRGGANILAPGVGNYTEKIQQLFGQDISQSFNFFGWQILQVPRENIMIVTVPQVYNDLNIQYVMNTVNRQWCQFRGIPMSCVKNVANWPMAGTQDGRVLILGVNYLDNNLQDGTLGDPIDGLIQPAFTYFQDIADFSTNKHFLMARAIWLAVSRPGFQVQMNTDFRPGYLTNIVSPAVPDGALWDSSYWDSAIWAGGNNTYADWQTVHGVGFSGQLAIATSVQVATILASIDYMMEMGGPM
jgi:hypothetical protein